MAKLGLGATFKLHNGTALTAFTEVTEVEPPTPKGSALETTHHGNSDGIRRYIPGLVEIDDLVVKGNCNPGDATHPLGTAQVLARTSRAFEATVPGASGGATQAFKYAGTCIPLQMKVSPVKPDGTIDYTFTAKIDAPVTETAI